MSCATYFAGSTVVHRLDPRARVVATLIVALLLASSTQFPVLWAGAGTGVLLAFLARLPRKPIAKRLLRLNLFMAVVFIMIPPTMPGHTAFSIMSIPFSDEGLRLAATITLKANAIVLVFTALLGTVELATLGHAFQHLHVPDKLTHLFLFTLRYLDVLHHEHLDMMRAMKARAFQPRMNLHTYRTYGYLLAMLLVRSLERAERVMAAMKCRGFKGQFYVYRHFAFKRSDLVFCAVTLAATASLAMLECSGRGNLW